MLILICGGFVSYGAVLTFDCLPPCNAISLQAERLNIAEDNLLLSVAKLDFGVCCANFF